MKIKIGDVETDIGTSPLLLILSPGEAATTRDIVPADPNSRLLLVYDNTQHTPGQVAELLKHALDTTPL